MTLIQTDWPAVNESDSPSDYTCEDLSVETNWVAVNGSDGPDDCTCEFVSVEVDKL